MAPNASSTVTPETIHAGSAFLSAFPKFLRTDITCKHIDADAPHELVQLLRESLIALSKTLASSSDSLEVTHWPGLFVVSSADGLTSQETNQDRGCFLLGLNDSISSDELDPVVKEWPMGFRKQTLFKDYYPPPLLQVRLVRQADLGHLILDQWMWPEALAEAKPLLFSSSLPDGVESFAFITDSQSIPETENTTAKKLTPASAILNRLRWDGDYESKDYAVVYQDRHDGLMEIGVDSWTTESTEEHFVPMHRIRSIRRKTTGMTVWHREERIDLISDKI